MGSSSALPDRAGAPPVAVWVIPSRSRSFCAILGPLAAQRGMPRNARFCGVPVPVHVREDLRGNGLLRGRSAGEGRHRILISVTNRTTCNVTPQLRKLELRFQPAFALSRALILAFLPKKRRGLSEGGPEVSFRADAEGGGGFCESLYIGKRLCIEKREVRSSR